MTGNAFGSSASVFDALSEIDSKFAKVVDKECDAVTGEVRKWFKKLAVRAQYLLKKHVLDVYICRRRRKLTTTVWQL